MKISIQATTEQRNWDTVAPVIHEVANDQEAYAIAMAISKQMGKVTVRVCDLNDWVPDSQITQAWVGRCNARYFQAK